MIDAMKLQITLNVHRITILLIFSQEHSLKPTLSRSMAAVVLDWVFFSEEGGYI